MRLIRRFFCSPLLWGGALCFGYYSIIHRGLIDSPLLIRYTAGHPVEYITVAMFLVGMTSLLFRALGLRRERKMLGSGGIFPSIEGKQESIDRVDFYLESLKKTERGRGSSMLMVRLKRALLYVKDHGSAEELDQELRYLADEDSFHADSHYGMVKMFIWAIPILGFLGTVIGITMALGNLDLTELETTGKLLAAGLQVAFDTTALALSLVFLLYFSLFFIRAQESRIYHTVDRLAEEELRGRFEIVPGQNSNQESGLVRQTLQTIVDSFDLLLKRQTTLWDEAIRNVNQRSARIAQETTQLIGDSLSESLKIGLESYSKNLIDGQNRLMTETVQPLIETLEKKTERLGAFKDQMVQEEKILLEVLQATGEITRLEDRLNHNLATLAGASCFEETVNSLAATIHLLNTKLGAVTMPANEIRLAAVPEEPGHHPSSVFPLQKRNDESLAFPADKRSQS